MAIIKEFWTNGNLIINNMGGINFNILPTNQSWEIRVSNRELILNIHTRTIEGIKYNPTLTFKIREDKINEVREFFNTHGIRYRVET